MTVEDVAAASGVAPRIINDFEKGVAVATTDLAAIARAVGLDFAALLDGRWVAHPVPSIFLRHQGHQDFDHRDADVLDEALDEGRALAQLHAAVETTALPLPTALFEPVGAASDHPLAAAQQGYALAREVRHWLQDPSNALGDVADLVERRLGIAVLVRSLYTARITALSVRGGSAAAIVLNAADPQRAANSLLARVHLAHEVCHVLFDPSEGGLHVVVDEIVDRKHSLEERRARAFAAELLLPLDGLRDLLGPALASSDDSRALEMVARTRSAFGTPHEITANHLCNRGFVHARMREWLVTKKTTFTGEPPNARLPRAGEPSVRVAELTSIAHRNGTLTDGDARSLLRLDRFAPLPWSEQDL